MAYACCCKRDRDRLRTVTPCMDCSVHGGEVGSQWRCQRHKSAYQAAAKKARQLPEGLDPYLGRAVIRLISEVLDLNRDRIVINVTAGVHFSLDIIDARGNTEETIETFIGSRELKAWYQGIDLGWNAGKAREHRNQMMKMGRMDKMDFYSSVDDLRSRPPRREEEFNDLMMNMRSMHKEKQR